MPLPLSLMRRGRELERMLLFKKYKLKIFKLLDISEHTTFPRRRLFIEQGAALHPDMHMQTSGTSGEKEKGIIQHH